jgi:hypothetical protein
MSVGVVVGMNATSFKADSKFYIAPDKLLPASRFTQPQAGGAPRGGRGGARGGSRGNTFSFTHSLSLSLSISLSTNQSEGHCLICRMFWIFLFYRWCPRWQSRWLWRWFWWWPRRTSWWWFLTWR